MSPTVSSIFDIQYRMYRNSTDPYSVLSWYTKPDYRTMSTILLEDKIKLVEGLITDLQKGGIGFRNHTAPNATLKYGATWTEDILFIEPETECASLNLSISALTPPWNFNERYLRNVSLVDEGGFSALPRTAPEISRRGTVNGQSGFDLKERASRAAWVNNYYTMLYLNLTNRDEPITRIDSTKGQRFELADDAKSNNFTIAFSAIQTNINFGSYLNLTTNHSRSSNPNNVTAIDFDTAGNLSPPPTICH